MITIAVVHLSLMILLPIMILLTWRNCKSWQLRVAVVFSLSVFTCAVYAFCIVFCPLDFLFGLDHTSDWTSVGVYKVRAFQHPSSDFYETAIEVQRADGKIARNYGDTDDVKMWNGRLTPIGDRLVLARSFGTQSHEHYVDCKNETVFNHVDGITAFTALEFR